MNLHIALVHYPTVDKTGSVVCTSVTNLDIHDFGRVATTYGARKVWIVHPYQGMQRFIRRVLHHWQDGWGSAYNPRRRESLARTELADDILSMVKSIEAETGKTPILVGTSARQQIHTVTYDDFRQTLQTDTSDQPYILVFGTGWGLHMEAMELMDIVLEPIYGPTEWNHLSVRGACAIILDRLCARNRPRFEDKS